VSYPRYPVVVTDDLFTYEFFSEGPAGRIRKVISYDPIGENLYNLAFGDWNQQQKRADDSTRSNNGDRDKILYTVGYTTLGFLNLFPESHIFIQGSTPARTRLYQMRIAENIEIISEAFHVIGFIEEVWEAFRPRRNYESFLIKRK
jgi:hypothetical protein